MGDVLDLRFTIERQEGGEVHYCACAWDMELHEGGKVICGWSAISMKKLMKLITQSGWPGHSKGADDAREAE